MPFLLTIYVVKKLFKLNFLFQNIYESGIVRDWFVYVNVPGLAWWLCRTTRKCTTISGIFSGTRPGRSWRKLITGSLWSTCFMSLIGFRACTLCGTLIAGPLFILYRLWPTYASAHNNLGTLITNKGEAEKHFLLAIRYSGEHVNAHYNLGQLYR